MALRSQLALLTFMVFSLVAAGPGLRQLSSSLDGIGQVTIDMNENDDGTVYFTRNSDGGVKGIYKLTLMNQLPPDQPSTGVDSSGSSNVQSSLVAGGTTQGFVDNAIGAAAHFSNPFGMAVVATSSGGRMALIGEPEGGCLRAVDVNPNTTYSTTTVAGSCGVVGEGSVDGDRSTSRFSAGMSFLATYNGDSVLIAGGAAAPCIRLVNASTSTTTTVSGDCSDAGGTSVDGDAATGRYYHPVAVVAASASIVYITQGDGAIRKLQHPSSTQDLLWQQFLLSTILTNPGARQPFGLCIISGVLSVPPIDDFLLVADQRGPVANVSTSGALLPLTTFAQTTVGTPNNMRSVAALNNGTVLLANASSLFSADLFGTSASSPDLEGPVESHVAAALWVFEASLVCSAIVTILFRDTAAFMFLQPAMLLPAMEQCYDENFSRGLHITPYLLLPLHGTSDPLVELIGSCLIIVSTWICQGGLLLLMKYAKGKRFSRVAAATKYPALPLSIAAVFLAGIALRSAELVTNSSMTTLAQSGAFATGTFTVIGIMYSVVNGLRKAKDGFFYLPNSCLLDSINRPLYAEYSPLIQRWILPEGRWYVFEDFKARVQDQQALDVHREAQRVAKLQEIDDRYQRRAADPFNQMEGAPPVQLDEEDTKVLEAIREDMLRPSTMPPEDYSFRSLIVSRFGVLFENTRDVDRWPVVGVHFGRAIFLSIVFSTNSCPTYGVIGVLTTMATAGALIIFAPYRIRGFTVCGVAINILLTILFLANMVPSLTSSIPWLLLVIGIFGVLCCVITIVATLVEHRTLDTLEGRGGIQVNVEAAQQVPLLGQALMEDAERGQAALRATADTPNEAQDRSSAAREGHRGGTLEVPLLGDTSDVELHRRNTDLFQQFCNFLNKTHQASSRRAGTAVTNREFMEAMGGDQLLPADSLLELQPRTTVVKKSVIVEPVVEYVQAVDVKSPLFQERSGGGDAVGSPKLYEDIVNPLGLTGQAAKAYATESWRRDVDAANNPDATASVKAQYHPDAHDSGHRTLWDAFRERRADRQPKSAEVAVGDGDVRYGDSGPNAAEPVEMDPALLEQLDALPVDGAPLVPHVDGVDVVLPSQQLPNVPLTDDEVVDIALQQDHVDNDTDVEDGADHATRRRRQKKKESWLDRRLKRIDDPSLPAQYKSRREMVDEEHRALRQWLRHLSKDFDQGDDAFTRGLVSERHPFLRY